LHDDRTRLPSWFNVDPVLPGLIREKLASLRDKQRIMRRSMWPTRRRVTRRQVDRAIAAFRGEEPETSEPDLARRNDDAGGPTPVDASLALVEGGGRSLEVLAT
jgi:hypothetical protein